MVKHCRTAINYCFVLLMLSVITIAACKKPADPPPSGSGVDNGDLKYTIEGVKDMTMERIGKSSQSLFVNRSSGKVENIMLSCVGLPKGALAKFSPISIGLPSFNTVLTIDCQRTPAGVYDIVVRGSSESSGYTEVPLKLTVLPYDNASIGLAGYFVEKNACTQTGNGGDTVMVEKVDAVKNRVNIKGIWQGVWSTEVYVNLNPSDNTLDMPVQTINGVSFSGTGTYDDNTMIIKYRVTGSTADDHCTGTFSRIY